MPAEIQPAELAHLIDFAERPRTHDWSLRSALVRYAQPEPERVQALLEVVRRVEWALGKETKRFEREGQELWNAFESVDTPAGSDAPVIELLRVAAELDRLGDMLATWAVDRAGDPPDGDVDRVTAEAGRQLEALGVPHEERPPGPRQRGV